MLQYINTLIDYFPCYNTMNKNIFILIQMQAWVPWSIWRGMSFLYLKLFKLFHCWLPQLQLLLLCLFPHWPYFLLSLCWCHHLLSFKLILQPTNNTISVYHPWLFRKLHNIMFPYLNFIHVIHGFSRLVQFPVFYSFFFPSQPIKSKPILLVSKL